MLGTTCKRGHLSTSSLFLILATLIVKLSSREDGWMTADFSIDLLYGFISYTDLGGCGWREHLLLLVLWLLLLLFILRLILSIQARVWYALLTRGSRSVQRLVRIVHRDGILLLMSRLEILVHLFRRGCLRTTIDGGEVLWVLLLRLDTVLGRLLVVDRVIDWAHLLVVTVSLLVQFALKFARLLHLSLQFRADVCDFSIQILDFSIFTLADQR